MAYRLIDPGSEWRLHRHRCEHRAICDLLGDNNALAGKNTYIVVWTYSQIINSPFPAISNAGDRPIRHQVIASEGHEENEGSVKEVDAHSGKTKAKKTNERPILHTYQTSGYVVGPLCAGSTALRTAAPTA